MPGFARKHQLNDNLIYHIYNRSNAKKVIFNTKKDFEYFIQILKKYQTRYEARIYHWVIMNNHYHFLLEMPEPELISKMMGGIAQAYTHYYHKINETSGYLWQGRYKMQPVEKELYFLTCGRYIERNPVRAGLVKKSEAYAFSSAQFYCQGKEDPITCQSPVYQDFGQDQEKRQDAYSQFLQDFDQEKEACFSQMDKPVGTKDFMNRLIHKDGRYMPRRRGRKREGFVL